MSYKRFAALFFCLLSMAIVSVVVYAQTNPEVKPDAAGMLPELNKWRTAIGLRPLLADDALSMAAQFHADDMVARNYFAHIAPSPVSCNGVMVTEPPQRVACFGRAGRGEDLAAGNPTPEEAIRGLIAHYPHCVDILKPTYTSMGGGTSTNVSNSTTYATAFDGHVDPETPVNIESFCGCTSDDSSVANLESCVKQHNDQFNGGSTPATLPALPLQVKMRLPFDANATYNNRTSGGQTVGRFAAGTVTVNVIPVSGNPSGITLDLGDGQFNKYPGATGTDTLTYTLTSVDELSVFNNAFNLAQGDSFTLEVLWTPADAGTTAPVADPVVEATPETAAATTCSQGGTNEAMNISVTNNTDVPLTFAWLDFECNEQVYSTIEPGATFEQGTFDGHEWVLRNPDGAVVHQFVAKLDNANIAVDSAAAAVMPEATEAPAEVVVTGCSFTVTTVEEMVNAINQSNDEQQCPGPDSIFVFSDIQVTASYQDSGNAFPVITSNIVISSMNRIISRDANAPAFRFFYVDGTNGNTGSLTLNDLQLQGGDAGEALDGGAVFVDARNGGLATFNARNVAFIGNKGNGNGGALVTLSMGGGQVDVVIADSVFDGNSGAYGGAFYSGGFDGGNANAQITNTNFTNNTATAEGGAIYNNGLGNGGHAQMVLENVTITGTTSPINDVVHNNGRAGGNATLMLSGTLLDGIGISFPNAQVIFNRGTEGSAITSWKDQQAGGSDNVCLSILEDGTGLGTVACP